MTIQINPPPLPPVLSGPAIAAAILHHVHEERRVPTASELIAWTDWRHPDGRARLAEATSILAGALQDMDTLRQHFPLIVQAPPRTVEKILERVVTVEKVVHHGLTEVHVQAVTDEVMSAFEAAVRQARAEKRAFGLGHLRPILQHALSALIHREAKA